MHNLTGVFVQKDNMLTKDGVDYYCFCVIYPNKKRVYLSTKEEVIDTWLTKIQTAVGYTNLTDIYQFRVSFHMFNFCRRNWVMGNLG